MDPETIMETIKECSKAANKFGGIIEKIFGPRRTKNRRMRMNMPIRKKLI